MTAGRRMRTALAGAAAGTLLACGPAIPEGLLEEFRTELARQAAAAAERGSFVVEGLDDWLFFGPELRHLSAGPFWGADAVGASNARDPANADPLPAILDFQRQLDAVGVELLIVPVPPKSVVYPEKVTDAVGAPIPTPRLDPDHQAFYDLLRGHGIELLDLTDRFIDDRFHPEGAVYCRRDTHWSGVGCLLAGQAIAEAIRGRDWYERLVTTRFTPRWYSTRITGDLHAAAGRPEAPREEVRLRGIAAAGGGGPVAPDPESPIVLLGDSHNLVFHAGGDLHATGAGLPDQLAFELGVPVDLAAVRGSGATAARVNLLRRAQRDDAYWDRKRMVVWCFAAREFTEGDGWALVPIAPGAGR